MMKLMYIALLIGTIIAGAVVYREVSGVISKSKKEKVSAIQGRYSECLANGKSSEMCAGEEITLIGLTGCKG